MPKKPIKRKPRPRIVEQKLAYKKKKLVLTFAREYSLLRIAEQELPAEERFALQGFLRKKGVNLEEMTDFNEYYMELLLKFTSDTAGSLPQKAISREEEADHLRKMNNFIKAMREAHKENLL